MISTIAGSCLSVMLQPSLIGSAHPPKRYHGHIVKGSKDIQLESFLLPNGVAALGDGRFVVPDDENAHNQFTR